MSDGKVVHAFPGNELPENPMQIEPRPFGFCNHENVRLSEHDREINCVKCGATLDAFDFVRSNASTIQRAWQNHKEASRIVDELHERIGALKKEEARLRAQVKRLQDKSGEVLSVRGKSIL